MARPPVLNVDDVRLRSFGHGDAFFARIARMHDAIGAKGFHVVMTEVPAGRKAYPFHAHHVMDELYVVLEGAGSYRTAGATHPLRSGDVVAAPAGEAHQVIASADVPLRYLAISTASETEVVDYPDSAKFGVMSRLDPRRPQSGVACFGRTGHSIDYWDGEDG